MTGAPGPGRGTATVSAQTLDPCALVTPADVEPLASQDVGAGVASSLPDFGYVTCRYAWGHGIDRFKLDVVVTDASRAFPGLTPAQVTQRVLELVKPGTGDAVIPEIGEAAVFKPEFYIDASATAFVKGRILQVRLDGLFAREWKDQLVELLKSAASRL